MKFGNEVYFLCLDMEGSDFVQNTANHASGNVLQLEEESVVTQFMGRFIIGAVAVVAGYYIYVKFLSRNQEDEPDAMKKLILDDPIGKLFRDAKLSMDKKTSEWWQSVQATVLTEELRSAFDTIRDVLEQLKKFDSELELQNYTTPVFVLLGIIRRAQEEEAAIGRVILPPLDEKDGENGDELTHTFDAKGLVY